MYQWHNSRHCKNVAVYWKAGSCSSFYPTAGRVLFWSKESQKDSGCEFHTYCITAAVYQHVLYLCFSIYFFLSNYSYFQLVLSLEWMLSWMIKAQVEAALMSVVMDSCLHYTYKGNSKAPVNWFSCCRMSKAPLSRISTVWSLYRRWFRCIVSEPNINRLCINLLHYITKQKLQKELWFCCTHWWEKLRMHRWTTRVLSLATFRFIMSILISYEVHRVCIYIVLCDCWLTNKFRNIIVLSLVFCMNCQ